MLHRVSKKQYNLLHPHCGPGNSIDDTPPKDPIDRACWEHDRAYAAIGPKAYTFYNSADQKFVETMDQIGGIAAKSYAAAFKTKKLVAPKLEEVSTCG
jgi:hypothetical protein